MRLFLTILLAAALGVAKAGPLKSSVGTIAGFQAEEGALEIRLDSGDAIVARFQPDSVLQKISPGAKDLKSAEAIRITDVAVGYRVLITFEATTHDIRRLVVMSAVDITRRNVADRHEWDEHGVAGIVSSKEGNRVAVRRRTFAGDIGAVVIVDQHTSFRRYAPNSVSFTDAQPSRMGEIAVGDQLRARGEKSEDGRQVRAREVVFGTFLVKAGTVSAVDPGQRQFNVKEFGTNRQLTISLTTGSQIKQLPGPAAGVMGRAGGGMPPPGAGPPAGFDINQMLEHLPVVPLASLETGTTVVVSSTKGTESDMLTAIMVLSNADMLIRMAARSSGQEPAGRPGDSALGSSNPGGLLGGGASALSNLGIGGLLTQ